MSEKLVNIITCDNMKADVVLLADGKITVMEFSQMHKKIEKLEASNAELLDVLEDFVIDVDGYFGFSETDDMEPEDDVAYFIGEYSRAKRLIKKAKEATGGKQNVE